VTRREAIEEWRRETLPGVRRKYEANGTPDYPARAMSWNVFVDTACREGMISPRQAHTWGQPPECSRGGK
jgi:hypothetical protein